MSADPDLAAMRAAYERAGLTEAEAGDHPLPLLRRWLADAVAFGIAEPNAMVVATATADGVPSARTVLLKGLDERGLVFFTNSGSQKGRELAENPRAAVVFPWHAMARQVRVSGAVSEVGEDDVAAYFASRPRESRLGAWASPQSQVIAGRGELDTRLAQVLVRFPEGAEVDVPSGWGGYRVTLQVVEFWNGRAARLHDRLRFTHGSDADGGWLRERLAP